MELAVAGGLGREDRQGPVPQGQAVCVQSRRTRSDGDRILEHVELCDAEVQAVDDITPDAKRRSDLVDAGRGLQAREPVEGRRLAQDIEVAAVDRTVERELVLGLAGHRVEVEGRGKAPALARPEEAVVAQVVVAVRREDVERGAPEQLAQV